MRTKIQNKRLTKLIAFLRALPRSKFYFGDDVLESKTNGHTCATVACAIGWTPAIFPRLVKWDFQDGCLNGYIMGKRSVGLYDVAEKILGCDAYVFLPNCQIYADNRLSNLPCDASPKQVAKMLEKYQKLVP